MIGGSQFLKEEGYKHLTDEDKAEVDKYVGFPNASVAYTGKALGY